MKLSLWRPSPLHPRNIPSHLKTRHVLFPQVAHVSVGAGKRGAVRRYRVPPHPKPPRRDHGPQGGALPLCGGRILMLDEEGERLYKHRWYRVITRYLGCLLFCPLCRHTLFCLFWASTSSIGQERRSNSFPSSFVLRLITCTLPRRGF